MLVSVIIPTYNRAGLISDTLDSVFDQDFDDLQVIVVDDGSTDDTVSVLAPYMNSITYIHQENMGAGPARNRGIEQARGQYIAFLDSDDMWQPFKLRLQIAILEAYSEISFLSTDFFIRKEGGRRIPRGHGTWFKYPLDLRSLYGSRVEVTDLVKDTWASESRNYLYIGSIYKELLRHPLVLPSTSLIRAADLPANLFFPDSLPLYEDWEFFARLSKGRKAGYLDLETTVNRGHRDAVRLTLTGQHRHAETRLSLISNVWRQDSEFLRENEETVHQVERDQYLILARYALLGSHPGKARRYLSRIELRWSALEVPLLHILAWMPFGCLFLRMLQKIERVIRPSQPEGRDSTS